MSFIIVKVIAHKNPNKRKNIDCSPKFWMPGHVDGSII